MYFTDGKETISIEMVYAGKAYTERFFCSENYPSIETPKGPLYFYESLGELEALACRWVATGCESTSDELDEYVEIKNVTLEYFFR